jgi:hypothetical protein
MTVHEYRTHRHATRVIPKNVAQLALKMDGVTHNAHVQWGDVGQ